MYRTSCEQGLFFAQQVRCSQCCLPLDQAFRSDSSFSAPLSLPPSLSLVETTQDPQFAQQNIWDEHSVASFSTKKSIRFPSNAGREQCFPSNARRRRPSSASRIWGFLKRIQLIWTWEFSNTHLYVESPLENFVSTNCCIFDSTAAALQSSERQFFAEAAPSNTQKNCCCRKEPCFCTGVLDRHLRRLCA